jgi:hypothetical protein
MINAKLEEISECAGKIKLHLTTATTMTHQRSEHPPNSHTQLPLYLNDVQLVDLRLARKQRLAIA